VGQQLGNVLVDRTTASGTIVRAVAGFDATLSAPKSLSVWWALTGEERLAECHNVAVSFTSMRDFIGRYRCLPRSTSAFAVRWVLFSKQCNMYRMLNRRHFHEVGLCLFGLAETRQGTRRISETFHQDSQLLTTSARLDACLGRSHDRSQVAGCSETMTGRLDAAARASATSRAAAIP
jgi:hypothetical protein